MAIGSAAIQSEPGSSAVLEAAAQSSETRQKPGLFDSVFHEVDEAIAIIRASPLNNPEIVPEIADVNQRFERDFGRERTQLIGTSLYDLVRLSDGHGDDARSSLARALNERRVAVATVTLQNADNDAGAPALPLELKIRPCATGGTNGEKSATFVCFIRPVEEAEEERLAARQITNRLLTFLSHDLRTPLNGILGFSEIMMNGVLGPLDQDTYEAYARDIHVAGQDLLRLVNGLLDLSHSEAGGLELFDHAFDIKDWIDAATAAMAGKARAKSIHLDTRIEPDLSQFLGDEARLRQVLLILISNAIKFTPRDSRITVSAARRADGLEVRVTDTGIGIAEKELRSAFLPYRRIEDVYTNPKAGVGVGLPLVKVLVEQHGGSVAIESRQNEGTTVILRLPPERLQ